MADRYTVYPGSFVCHTCKSITHSMRHYFLTKEITWVCKEKHMSKVSLETRKSRRDYDRAK